MMNLIDVTERVMPPTTWEEGDNIPWDEPEFSERMLAEHLRQDHDAASRRFEKIDEQVRWIDGSLLSGAPARVLELACGPGLYTSRLARLGHECRGIDFAPAAVRHGSEEADRDGLACSYELADVREVRLDEVFGGGFGLVMMISGQFNVFRRSEARGILERAFEVLAPSGQLLLEPQRFSTVKDEGEVGASWYSASEGLFSSRPHLCLTESFWNEEERASTRRFLIVDAETSEVTRYAMSNEAYSDEEYEAMVRAAGFEDVELVPSLVGVEDESQRANLAVIARKPRSGGS
jgi:SAM-dependent methyltransferase